METRNFATMGTTLPEMAAYSSSRWISKTKHCNGQEGNPASNASWHARKRRF